MVAKEQIIILESIRMFKEMVEADVEERKAVIMYYPITKESRDRAFMVVAMHRIAATSQWN